LASFLQPPFLFTRSVRPQAHTLAITVFIDKFHPGGFHAGQAKSLAAPSSPITEIHARGRLGVRQTGGKQLIAAILLW
jgi:hypothetical protein